MNDYERGWVEAFVDSEGGFCFYKNKDKSKRGFVWSPTLAVGNTDKALLEKFIRIVGNGKIYGYPMTKNPLLKKPFYTVKLTAGSLRELLPRITLVAKERQRQLTLEVLAITATHSGVKNQARLEQIYFEMRSIHEGNGEYEARSPDIRLPQAKEGSR